MGYGFSFYRWGCWFGFGQIQFDKHGVTVCFFKDYSIYPDGYSRHWFRIGR